MSGWFDGSGDGTNDAFYGIAAGHRGRRHHQQMRRQPMRRFGVIKPPEGEPVKTSMYKDFVIKCQLSNPFSGTWKCTATLNQGLTYKTLQITAGSSAEANNKIKDMIDLYWEKQEPKPDPKPDPLPYQPVPLPNDFIAGQYTVRATYSGASTQYIVTVFSGNVSLQSESYTQHNGAAAINKFNTFTSLVTKKAKYDLEVSKTDTKGNYNIDLQVILQGGGGGSDTLGGFFSGIMNMFGLGGGHDAVVKQRMAEKHRNLSLTAQETPNMLPTAMQGRTHSMYTKNYNTIGSGLGESHGTSWSSMPAKKFQVVVSRMGEGTVVKKYPETGDYGTAVEQYDAELLTIANDPGFYDPIDEPPKDPPIDGGGDLTDPTTYWINLDGTVGTGLLSAMPEGSTEISKEKYQAILDSLDPGDDPPGAIVLTQPTSTYQTQTLTENQWVMNQQSARENAVAMDSNNANLLLGAAALAGAIYLARK